MNFFSPNFSKRAFTVLFSFLLLFLCGSLRAQEVKKNPSGEVSGRIIDSATAKPIEYATISLFQQEENKVVNGTTSDDAGFFKLTEIKPGTYKMLVYFIGYQVGSREDIVISRSSPTVSLGNFRLSGRQVVLNTVTVTGEKNVIENRIDKMIYNADKDITSQSGVATDVLKKIPQVSIDADGNVELQGNSGIRFLINGKPSTIFGNNIADILQSIPASQIQSIEVITTPGAKYDAEGTAGIINIILKKSTAEGFNGALSFTGGSRLENGSLNLNAHHKHFGINAFLSGNAQLSSSVVSSQDRSSSDDSTNQSSRLLQNGSSDFSRSGYQSGLSFEWDLTGGNTLSGSVGYDYFGNKNSGGLIRRSMVEDSFGDVISDVTDEVITSNKFHEESFDYSVDYKKSFKQEDQELELSLNSSIGRNLSYYDQAQDHLPSDNTFEASYGNDPGVENETEIALDYQQPLGKEIQLETGVKTGFNKIESTSEVYLQNPVSNTYDFNTTQSSMLNYKSNVYAGYLSASFRPGKFLNIKSGLRYERTEINAWFSNSGDAHIRPYNTCVPSLLLSCAPGKNQIVKIGYSHRIERPEYRDLNPFLNASDPKNITTGNPNLRPEAGDKIELTYGRNFEKGVSINATLFYRGNKDDIQFFTRYYPSFIVGDSTYYNVAISSRENVGREDNFGASFFVSVPMTSKISLRSNLSGFERYIINGALPGNNVHGFIYRINLNAAYQLSELINIEVFGNFNSPRINTQGTFPSFTTYNFAFRRQLFHKKASIALTATNPFEKYVTQKTVLAGENFTSTAVRELPYRSFGINFTFKFGRLEFKKEKEAEDINLTNPPSDLR